MSVKKRSISFDSADGHTKVAAYLYTDAARPPRAVVQLSHGMCEYIGRYDDFAAYLCGQGYAVCGTVRRQTAGRLAILPITAALRWCWRICTA